MPAMAGDWPRDPRAYGSPKHLEPPAPVRTLPGVAELLSTRPSASSTIPAYQHHPDYFHTRSTPPTASLPPATAAATASSHWNPVNRRPSSPSVSPTEHRPLSDIVRVYQQPVLRRQQLPKPDPALRQSALSSGAHSASNSTVQARQDSAIDHHRFETANDAQLSKSNISYSHQSPKEDARRPSPTLSTYQPAPSTAPNQAGSLPNQAGSLPNQAGSQSPVRHHSVSLSSGAPHSASAQRSYEPGTERIVPVDTRNGSDPRLNITGPSSLPEQFFTQQSNFGTRQQRYNVRFAANYTSENMPSSQKPRNEPPTSPRTPAVVAEPEQSRSSPIPTPVVEDPPTSASNGSTYLPTEPQQSWSGREPPRERGDREPSVERCVGCNEAWRRPIPDMDSDKIAPAQNDAEYMRIAGNLIERLRNERKKADAAYDEWKWRHSHCYRQPSPYAPGSVDDSSKATAATHGDGAVNGNTTTATTPATTTATTPATTTTTTTTTTNKRKSEIPHEPSSASKQQRLSNASAAPAVREPDSS